MSKTTEQVLNHHLESFGGANIEEILSDYTQDSILVDQKKTYKGIEEIRVFFEWLLELLPPGSDFEMEKLEVINEYAYIAWNASSKKANFLLGTDTFHIVNGKIKYQSVAARMTEK
ncbi:nuclear transport factor 2 family protein [Maribacter sp. 2210JD10-5]|uniref:nuclear transport factor 2 family protein n=1 Tax=Maribacter sp. 2210JD10-5 TaxID=3386272 RepID=UPI0039BD3FC4